jgi:hypothetical protein
MKPNFNLPRVFSIFAAMFLTGGILRIGESDAMSAAPLLIVGIALVLFVIIDLTRTLVDTLAKKE